MHIFHFQGNKREVELVEYLVIHTVVLEKIQLDQKRLAYLGDGEWMEDWWEVDIKRKRVFELLRERIPTTTNLTML